MNSFISLIFAAAIAIGMTACSNADENSVDNIAKSDKSGIKTSYVQTDKEGAKLSSFLTPLESSLAYQRTTMLFDDLSNAEHRVAIGMITYPREELILKYEDWKKSRPEMMTEEEFSNIISSCETYSEPFVMIDGSRYRGFTLTKEFLDLEIRYDGQTYSSRADFLDKITEKLKKDGKSSNEIASIILDTKLVLNSLYDGTFEERYTIETVDGAEKIRQIGSDGSTNSLVIRKENVTPVINYAGSSFKDDESFLNYVSESLKEYGYDDAGIRENIECVKINLNAIRSNSYIELPDYTWHFGDEEPYSGSLFGDLRSKWEITPENAKKLKTCTDEIVMYDQELATTFVAEVTTPSNYDKTKTYPILFMIDSVWRMNDHARLREAMEKGESAPVILVSLGFNYNIDNTSDMVRFQTLINNRLKLVDFITDNLMPTICEKYNVDCQNSTLFGHSMGGVFAHAALFTSDQQGSNQPFGSYIIASPVFWQLYTNNNEIYKLDPETAMNEYGYFDRNKTLDKKVFIFGGRLEDSDYLEQYGKYDSTVTGITKLEERLKAHGVDLYSKLYESHHYQYVSDMLLEYLKAYYPNNK